MNEQLTREYIRHPADIPLEVSPYGHREQLNLQLNNISVGGMAFVSPTQFNMGSVVDIKIRQIRPIFRVHGIVQWCEVANDHYEVGVRFLDQEDAYRVRMVEQICHIEQYRRLQRLKSGRRISKNKASAEWIEQHGASFPKLS